MRSVSKRNWYETRLNSGVGGEKTRPEGASGPFLILSTELVKCKVRISACSSMIKESALRQNVLLPCVYTFPNAEFM